MSPASGASATGGSPSVSSPGAPGLRVVRTGPGATLQDLGRSGFRDRGIPVSGTLLASTLRVLNALVRFSDDGNPACDVSIGTSPRAPEVDVAAGIEFVLMGLTLEVIGQPLRIAVGGACPGFEVWAGVPELSRILQVGPYEAVTVPAGAQIIVAAPCSAGIGLLAINGEWALPRTLASHATLARAGLGGVAGRALVAGDYLDLKAAPRQDNAVSSVEPLNANPAAARARIAPTNFTEVARMLGAATGLGGSARSSCALRAVAGPQSDAFESAALDEFFSAHWRVTEKRDRMGVRLEGPRILHATALGFGPNIASDAAVPGAIQVPGDGQPIVLMADCQTTGGYTKIATVIGCDLERLAQVPPGSVVTFERMSPQEAVAAARANAAWLDGLIGAIEAAQDETGVDPVRLADENLISGVVDALRPAD